MRKALHERHPVAVRGVAAAKVLADHDVAVLDEPREVVAGVAVVAALAVRRPDEQGRMGTVVTGSVDIGPEDDAVPRGHLDVALDPHDVPPHATIRDAAAGRRQCRRADGTSAAVPPDKVPLMAITARPGSADEFEEFAHVADAAFGEAARGADAVADLGRRLGDRFYVAFEDGAMVGTSADYGLSMSIPGGVLTSGTSRRSAFCRHIAAGVS